MRSKDGEGSRSFSFIAVWGILEQFSTPTPDCQLFLTLTSKHETERDRASSLGQKEWQGHLRSTQFARTKLEGTSVEIGAGSFIFAHPPPPRQMCGREVQTSTNGVVKSDGGGIGSGHKRLSSPLPMVLIRSPTQAAQALAPDLTGMFK